MDRRVFLASLAVTGVACTAGDAALIAQAPAVASAPVASEPQIPRFRGFHLQWERRPEDTSKPAIAESDFAMMQGWGFNFARLPLSYWIWPLTMSSIARCSRCFARRKRFFKKR